MEKFTSSHNYDSIPISSTALAKAQFAKSYIEMKYSLKKKKEEEKIIEWCELNKHMDNLGLSATEKKLMKNEILHKEAQELRENRRGMSIFDFEPESIIGRGAYGEVHIVRHKKTGEVFALKKMIKSDMIIKNQVHNIKSERNILALADNPWVVELKYSFQDENHLYLVMEYLPGGDLMNIFIKKDRLPENDARFYIAECVMAIESVHNLNYIHRDLKPDNILIDKEGHIKLADFGLCKCSDFSIGNPFDNLTKLEEEHMEKQAKKHERSRKLLFSTVGTPDYIAPEIFGRGGYDESVDWWSLGVIFFEMIIGYPPFYSNDPKITCQKILNWKRTFKIPPEAEISPEAQDLILKLITDRNSRLGRNGANEIKSHSFFTGIDWDNLRTQPSCWVPDIESDVDPKHFDTFEEQEAFYPPIPFSKQKSQRKDSNFIGFTFKRKS